MSHHGTCSVSFSFVGEARLPLDAACCLYVRRPPSTDSCPRLRLHRCQIRRGQGSWLATGHVVLIPGPRLFSGWRWSFLSTTRIAPASRSLRVEVKKSLLDWGISGQDVSSRLLVLAFYTFGPVLCYNGACIIFDATYYMKLPSIYINQLLLFSK